MDQKEPNTSGGSDNKVGGRKLSGAARRRLRKERRLGQGGTGGPGKPGMKVCPLEPKPGTSTEQGTQKEGHPKVGGTKRNRSEGSTPDNISKPPKKKSGMARPSTSYAEALTDIRVAIVPQGFPENVLSEEQAGLIKTALLQALDSLTEGEPPPRFSGVNLKGGFLLASCADQATKDWLVRVVTGSEPWPGAKLSIVDAKDVPKPVRTMVWIPGPNEEPEKVLRRLKTQNPGLLTETWSVVDKKLDPKGQQLILLMGESSWEKIQSLQCRPYLNLSRVLFKRLGKNKDRGAEEKMEVDKGGADNEPPASTGE